MKVIELIEKLRLFPPDAEVMKSYWSPHGIHHVEDPVLADDVDIDDGVVWID